MVSQIVRLPAIRPEHRTHFAVMCLISVIDGADLAMLGTLFRSFEEDLHIGPVILGLITMAQSVSSGLSTPLWGWMCDTGIASFSQLWAFGTFGWGVVMVLLAFSFDVRIILLLRFANGIFLACFAPLLQSWVATHVPAESSGLVFGTLMGAAKVGKVVSTGAGLALMGVNVPISFVTFGIGSEVAGWRLLCLAISLAAFVMSAVVSRLEDSCEKKARNVWSINLSSLVDAFGEMQKIVRDHWEIYTFRILVVQGVLGGTVCNAFSFDILYLQYLGFSSSALGFLIGVVVVPELIASITGGLLGDILEGKFGARGRAYAAQICVSVLILYSLLCYIIMPATVGAAVVPFALCKVLLVMGGEIYHPGVMRPLLARVAAPNRRASIIAWQFALEGTSAALLGAPLVGFLTEKVFGYTSTTRPFAEIDPVLRDNNRVALQRALAVMSVVPYIVCLGLNSLLHWTIAWDSQIFGSKPTKNPEDKGMLQEESPSDDQPPNQPKSDLIGRRAE